MSARRPPGVGWRPARRTSFARRDSNLALIGAMLSGLVIGTALILILLSRLSPDQGSRLRGAVADLLRPVHAVVLAPFRLVGAAADAVGDHWQAVHHVRAMEAELAAARARAARAEQLATDLSRLERLLEVQRPGRLVVASAAASIAPASAGERIAIIGAGRNHGVRPGMPVMGAEGLVGRTLDVGMGAARIKLVTDPNSRVPVTVVRNGWSGIVAGRGTHVLELQFDPQGGDDRLRAGDRLITSGDGGVFPPGVLVGTIIDAGTEPPRVRPAMPGGALGVVQVEAPWLPPAAAADASAAGSELPAGPESPATTTATPDGAAAAAARN